MTMHTGEEWFSMGWQQYAVLGVLLVVYLFLVFANKLPKMQSFKDFVDVINSSGGHIVLLSLFTWWSIKIAMQFFYHTMALPDETVSKHDALVSQGIQFVAGTLVGSFLGALLKTMSGGKANGTPPSWTSTTTSSSTPSDPSSPVVPRGITGGSLSAAVAVPAATGSPTATAGNEAIGITGEHGEVGSLGTNQPGTPGKGG